MPLPPSAKRRPGRPRLGHGLSTTVSLRLDPESAARLRELAERQGIGPTKLLRAWVLEHLQLAAPE
jgi:hypothetical protein